MADNISKITVKIGGMNYQLLAAENEIYMRQVAAHADEMIRRVMQNNPHLTLSMSTVLALVNAVDEQYNARKGQEDAEHKKIDAEKKLAELKSELMRCREQTWEIKKDLLHYQNLCKEYEELLESETTSDEAVLSSIESEAVEVSEDMISDNEDDTNNTFSESEEFQPFEQTRLDDYLQATSAEKKSELEIEQE